MADPTKYEVDYSFSGYQAVNPGEPLPAPALDNELANIETAISSAVDAITDIRRSDGALQNGIVGADSLSPELSFGFTFRNVWQSGISYNVRDGVSYGARFYTANSAHTSSPTNRPDLDSATWTLGADFTPAAAAAVSTLVLDTFTGDDVTTVFTLSAAPGLPQNAVVLIDGVKQPVSEYSVSGTTLTFTSAPPKNLFKPVNIEVLTFLTASIGQNINAASVTVSPSVAGGANVQSSLTAINSTAGAAASAASVAQTTANTALSTASTAVSAAAAAAASTVDTARLVDSAVTFPKLNAAVLATQAEAEAGAASDKLMTPERVAEAIAALAPTPSVSGRLISRTIYTANATWTKSTNNPTLLRVIMRGGGGGGGGTNGSSTGARAGAGGGQGAYLDITLGVSSLGATESITIGAGGANASPGNNSGGTGGSTSFGSWASAPGGAGGSGSGVTDYIATTGGAGGAGSGTGSILSIRGMAGGAGLPMSSTACVGGDGGGEGCGRGGVNNEGGVSAAANSGGGGGGGAACNNNTSRGGGSGGAGWMIIEEYA